MNKAQVAKLQKKVAREHESKKQKEAKKLNEEKRRITQQILHIEKDNHLRGNCVCCWNGIPYHVINGKLTVAKPLVDFDLEKDPAFDVIFVRSSTEKYYLMAEDKYKQIAAIRKWFTDNYAILRIAVLNSSRSDIPAKERLDAIYTLGALSQEFLDKFPSLTRLDFIQMYKTYDNLITNELHRMEDIVHGEG